MIVLASWVFLGFLAMFILAGLAWAMEGWEAFDDDAYKNEQIFKGPKS